MFKTQIRIIILIICLTGVSSETVYSQAFPGYTLYTSTTTRTNLLDINNNVVKFWTHTRSGGYSVYLQPDGTLWRPALSSGSGLNGGAAA
ncbi:MAG: hypothetical protein IPI04_18595 [Ignavibacteria bacterium]|nr:hypothetical protein [Ignavibacteria bacterium]